MCQAGGPRCSNHALKTLIKDKAKVKEAMSSEDDKQIAESQDKASHSLLVWYSTPQGQEHLNDKIDGAETEEDRQKYTKILDKAKQIRYEQSEDGRAYRAQIAEDKKFESEFKKIPRKEREERKELVDKLMSAQKKAPNAFTQQALDSSLQWSGEKPQWYYEEADVTEKHYGTKPEIIDTINVNGQELAVMWSDNSPEQKEITLQMEDGYDLSTLEYRDMETGERVGYVKTMLVTEDSLTRSYGDDEYSTYRFYQNKNRSLLLNEQEKVEDASYRGYHIKQVHPLETAKTEEETFQAKKKMWVNSHRTIDKFPESVDTRNDESLYSVVNLQERHVPEDPEVLDQEIASSRAHMEKEKRKFFDSNQHPFIDFSRLEDKYQSKGVGTSMYVYMARKLGEKGKSLSSSGLQSDEAQRLWGSMIRQRGVPTKVTTTVFEKEEYKGYSNRFTIDFSKK